MIASSQGHAPIIRDAEARDEADWRRLWAGYLGFYAATVDDTVTTATWRKLLTPDAQMIGRVAELQGCLAGFTVSVVHPGSWSCDLACYLEDLFVDPAARGGGIGSALIADLVERCRMQGWSRLYWHTRADNAAARRVYDKFATADDFVRYRMFIR